MIRFLLLAAVVVGALSACTTPTPGLMRVEPVIIDMPVNRFKIWASPGGYVEAHRINFAVPPPSRVGVLAEAEAAIVKATGCAVIRIEGDHALVKAEIKC